RAPVSRQGDNLGYLPVRRLRFLIELAASNEDRATSPPATAHFHRLGCLQGIPGFWQTHLQVVPCLWQATAGTTRPTTAPPARSGAVPPARSGAVPLLPWAISTPARARLQL